MKLASKVACLFALLVLTGCGSNTSDKAAQPVESAEAAAEAEYGTAYLNLMREFKANANKANEELDDAEAKGLPSDRKAKRAILIDLMERNDRRAEALLMKARRVQPPPRFIAFHATVMKLLGDMVAENTRYTEAVSSGNPNASKISEEGVQTMLDNYQKMSAEGEKLGIPMVDISF
jgi:hypothetical protein